MPKHPKSINIECKDLQEINKKAAALEKMSVLSVEVLDFLSGLNLQQVDNKLKNATNRMALKTLI